MKSVVIYDSFFGNTEKVAKVIADELLAEMINIKNQKPSDLTKIELVIVGSPTRAFRPSPDIFVYLNNLPNNALSNKKVAAFDTRIDPKEIKKTFLRKVLMFLVAIFGYADKPIQRLLKSKGGEIIIDPAGFFVEDKEGPIRAGELEKAGNWAKRIKEIFYN